jgi:serine protease Do
MFSRALSIAVMSGAISAVGVPAQSMGDDGRSGIQRDLRPFAAQIRPEGSYIGVKLVDLDPDRAKTLKLTEERGVEVTAVEEGSPAESAGIRKGDVFLNYNGENILGAQQFVRLVHETPQGRKVKIQLWRDGKAQTVMVTTGAARFHVPQPSDFGLNFPEVRVFSIPDIPNPMLVWKNSTLGIECESVDSQLAQYFGVRRGLLIRSVEKSSVAEKAGLKAGDVLTAIGDKSLGSVRDMTSYFRMQHQPGKTIPISLMRDHKELTLNIVSPDDRE